MTRALLAICLLLSQASASAGEFECFITCRLDRLSSSVKWKPTGCFKPSPPMIFASNVAEYNIAVDEFNMWLSKMKVYLSCVNSEAKGDIENAGKVVVDGANREVEETNSEISRARSNLLMQRPLR